LSSQTFVNARLPEVVDRKQTLATRARRLRCFVRRTIEDGNGVEPIPSCRILRLLIDQWPGHFPAVVDKRDLGALLFRPNDKLLTPVAAR
jgi:hypothetical protein